MAPDISGGLRNSATATKSKQQHALKKGPWTTSEDTILVEYVKKHGEGNWNAVQRNSGLMRCGKSCRLRWANHLRPNLKKGAFTPDEEKLIVDLHAKLGNKWARMAAQLPGRTDNEIKNYWNTRLKRRQRAGLPIYPQQEHHHHHQLINSPSPNPLIYYDAFANSPSLISPSSHNQLNLYAARGSLTATSFSSNPFFNHQGISSNPLPMPSLPQYNALDYGVVEAGSDTAAGVLGLPSIQSSAAVTPAASSSDFVVGTTSSDGEVEPGFGGCSKSGLLEDLLGGSYNNALAYPEKTEEELFIGGDEEEEEEEEEEEGFGFDNNYEGGINSREENNCMDEDLLNLLDNFPLSVPIPDWDGNESPMLSDGTNGGMESQPNDARYNQVATSNGAANQDWNFGSSCLWNNMPSIY